MFLFIFESIGTSELLLIGIIALIFLGPRKLPQMAKTIGKTMADFRRTTNEFKSTWEREVDLESLTENETAQTTPPTPVARVDSIDTPESISAPEIRQLDDKTARALKESAKGKAPEDQPEPLDKRSWL